MHVARDATGKSTGFLPDSAICGVWSAHIHCAALDTSVSGCIYVVCVSVCVELISC